MEGDLKRLVTARGLLGAGLFMIAGLAYLYIFRSKIGLYEALIDIGFLNILAPAACIWINRKPEPASEGSKLIQ